MLVCMLVHGVKTCFSCCLCFSAYMSVALLATLTTIMVAKSLYGMCLSGLACTQALQCQHLPSVVIITDNYVMYRERGIIAHLVWLYLPCLWGYTLLEACSARCLPFAPIKLPISL